ncbi:MAG: helix-turn-helix domain-containing protein, partial [Euryarchaeota archaeon]|nr:helix-turn-helix domain-containing protein [Euryarchaeota archaeon]
MARGDVRINVAVADRVLLHLWEQDHQADHYLVSFEMTRPGIAEVCALHPPNVSRTMRELIQDGLVSEYTRTIRGDERRQKTWQLTDEGRTEARNRIEKLRSMMILIREREGNLLEIRADKAAVHLQTGLTLLQVLMHAQHEGVLNFGDIRF